MKAVTIVGARPQFIKAATVSRIVAEREEMDEVLVHTGQHFDANMSEVFFAELAIPKPKYNLGIGGGLHGRMTGLMLGAIEEVLVKERPDWVVVYGDTNSTLAGALAAAKLGIRIAHVEAGLRSFNRKMPEEVNRCLTDHAADLLFTPTDSATENLGREGVAPGRIRQIGDVMYDAALFYSGKAERESGILTRHGLTPGNFILATVHRQENTDDLRRLTSIFSALQKVACDMPVAVPLHPRTRNSLERSGRDDLLKGLVLMPPVSYLDMVMLEKSAALIATDSGGVQKEAFFYNVPCVTLRDETEWVELIDLGWNRLAPPLQVEIVEAIRGAIGIKGAEGRFPYGDGAAAESILCELSRFQDAG